MSGGDWSAVEELITNFKSWLFQVESIEIALKVMRSLRLISSYY